MQYQDILEATKTAFQKHEFYELLTGQGEYHLSVLDYPVSVPTDWGLVIQNGIHALYRATQDKTVLADYETAIQRLLDEGGMSVWIAAYILFSQLTAEYDRKASFCINRDIFQRFHKAVHDNLNYLQTHTTTYDSMTCYEDILRLNLILYQDYKITFLPTTS